MKKFWGVAFLATLVAAATITALWWGGEYPELLRELRILGITSVIHSCGLGVVHYGLLREFRGVSLVETLREENLQLQKELQAAESAASAAGAARDAAEQRTLALERRRARAQAALDGEGEEADA